MSIWTRISEALALVGDSIGGFLAKLATARVTAPEKSLGFTIGMIALGAKMAKADGVVTLDEVAAFKQVFPCSASGACGGGPGFQSGEAGCDGL